MDKGIADRLLFFLKPESPLRSDRVLAIVTAVATIYASYQGVAPGPLVDQVVTTWGEVFNGASGVLTALAALIGGLGLGHAATSPRPF